MINLTLFCDQAADSHQTGQKSAINQSKRRKLNELPTRKEKVWLIDRWMKAMTRRNWAEIIMKINEKERYVRWRRKLYRATEE